MPSCVIKLGNQGNQKSWLSGSVWEEMQSPFPSQRVRHIDALSVSDSQQTMVCLLAVSPALTSRDTESVD